jgi:hypothetical protein
MESKLLSSLTKVSETLGYFEEYSREDLLKLQELLWDAKDICPEIVEEDTMAELAAAIKSKGGDEAPTAVPESAEDMKKYQDLAEKLFIVKHLKEQKNITEKQKKFIETTEKVELTDKERVRVMELYGKLVPKKA